MSFFTIDEQLCYKRRVAAVRSILFSLQNMSNPRIWHLRDLVRADTFELMMASLHPYTMCYVQSGAQSMQQHDSHEPIVQLLRF